MPQPFTALQSIQDHGFFVLPVRRVQHRDRAADHFGSRVAEHVFGCLVPCCDDAIECLADDRVVRRFDDAGKVQPSLAATPFLGDVVVDLGHQGSSAGRIAAQRLVTDHDDFLSVAPPVVQLAGPFVVLEQFPVGLAQRSGKLGLQQPMRYLADRLCGGEAVQPLHAARPEADLAFEAACHDLRQAELGCSRLQ